MVPASFWIWWARAAWGGDIYTLTANRIIDIERVPLGLRELRRESTLDRIQDIEVRISGVLQRVFDVGDVYIRTAAGGDDFTFRRVANPRSVQRDIFHRLAEFRRQEEEQQRRQRFEEMTKWLGVYHDVVKEAQMQAEANLEEESERE
jgi:uncharacterized membrane protein YdbT with pleckstrin-like domain